jgi:hypothetical protein
MSSRHRRTLEAVFRDPVSPTIVWMDVEKMLLHYGATIEEGSGSRISVEFERDDLGLSSASPSQGSEVLSDP